MGGSDDVTTRADVIPNGTECLLHCVEVPREGLAVIGITENHNGFDAALNGRGELLRGEVDKLSSLAVGGGQELRPDEIEGSASPIARHDDLGVGA